jgi:hypothetical protein
MGSRYLGLALAAAACADVEPPPELAEPPDIETTLAYESEYVQVFTRPGRVFCRGDGARMDAHIERLSALLEVEPPPQIPVYVVEDSDEDLINEWCFGTERDDTTIGGCFHNWMIVMQARFWSHELDHAVLHMINPGRPAKFWEEGYASAWETEQSGATYFDLLPEQNPVGAYGEAQSLVRGLTRTYGILPVRDFYATLEPDWTPEERESAFADVFGVSYEEALVRYESETPLIYPGFGWCDGVEVIDVPLGDTQMTLHLDCDAPDTHTFRYYTVEGMYVRRILRLEQMADLTIEWSPGGSVAKRHPCLETPVESESDPRLLNGWFESKSIGEQSTGHTSWPDRVPAGDNLFEFAVPFGAPVMVEAIIHAEPSEPLP